jgi:uncharacterized repeat protein (TIGR02543 family)
MTLYAKWTAVSGPQIVFDVNAPAGELPVEGTSPAPIAVVYGAAADRPESEPIVEGYRFAGWYQDTGGEEPFAFAGDSWAVPVTQDTTVHAGWVSEPPVAVSFGAGLVDGEPAELLPGASLPAGFTVPYNAILPAVAAEPKVLGHRFTGWWDDADRVIPGATRLTAPAVLLAGWDAVAAVVEVTFGAGTATLAENLPETQVVALNGTLDTANMSEPLAAGYQFTGWSAAPDGPAIVDLASYRIDPPSDALTLYAQWEARPDVTVTLNPGERTVVSGMPAGASIQAAYNGVVALPALLGVGALFDAWTACPAGLDQAAIGDQFRPTGNVELCARWLDAAKISIVFDAGGGAAIPAVLVDIYGQISRPADPVAEGKTFGGWFADPELTVPFDFDATVVTAPLTVYAKWTVVDLPGGNDCDGDDDEDGDCGNGGNGTGGGGNGGGGNGGSGSGGNGGGGNGTGGGGTGGSGGGGSGSGGGGSNPTPDETPALLVTSIVIGGAAAMVQLPGKGTVALPLTAQVTPADATVAGVVWSVVSGPANIDAAGLVTFTGAEGEVVLRATATDGSGTQATVTVNAVRAVASIRTPATSLYIQSGKSLKLPLAIDDATDPAAPTTAKLTFTSSNSKVATVSSSGAIKAAKVKKASKTAISVQAGNGKTLRVNVTVVPKAKKLTGLQVKGLPAKNAIRAGKSAKLAVKLSPKDATGVALSFKSSKASVLRVDKAGKITALKKGKAVITVKAAGKTVKTKPITVS